MKKLRISLLVSSVALSLFACNSQQEPKKDTSQDSGVNTLDGTKYQKSDTAAPGTNSAPNPGQTTFSDTTNTEKSNNN
jgi:hypothetical protein